MSSFTALSVAADHFGIHARSAKQLGTRTKSLAAWSRDQRFFSADAQKCSHARKAIDEMEC